MLCCYKIEKQEFYCSGKRQKTSDRVSLTLAKLYISFDVMTADNILDAVFFSATFWLN